MSEPVKMHYEPKFRAMWHDNCTSRFGGPMVPTVLQVWRPEGFTQRLWKCVTCETRAFYGVDNQQIVRISGIERVRHCSYPDCNCPFDMGPDNQCLRGLPRPKQVVR